MADMIQGDEWKNIGTVGTNALNRPGIVLRRVILPGTYVGTVEWYDAATAAGTSATNFIHSQGLPLLRQWDSYEVNATCKKGLVTVATGTPTLTFTVG